ncbi:hypothetical protein N7523_006207 [Penicillium sp. IBT 18751x]|nr:hypothetical protein N7523_006207 [Penicillium sp. IBT 18751x]
MSTAHLTRRGWPDVVSPHIYKEERKQAQASKNQLVQDVTLAFGFLYRRQPHQDVSRRETPDAFHLINLEQKSVLDPTTRQFDLTQTELGNALPFPAKYSGTNTGSQVPLGLSCSLLETLVAHPDATSWIASVLGLVLTECWLTAGTNQHHHDTEPMRPISNPPEMPCEIQARLTGFSYDYPPYRSPHRPSSLHIMNRVLEHD